HRGSPLLESLLAGIRATKDSCRVHEKVDSLDRLHGWLECLRSCRIRHDKPCTHLLGRNAQRLLATGSQHNVVAEFSELAPTGFSDTAAAPGDQCCSHATPLSGGGAPSLAATVPQSAVRDRLP